MNNYDGGNPIAPCMITSGVAWRKIVSSGREAKSESCAAAVIALFVAFCGLSKRLLNFHFEANTFETDIMNEYRSKSMES